MKKFLYLFLLVVFGLCPEPMARERFAKIKEDFARKKKVKKAKPLRMGTQENKQKRVLSSDAPLTLLDEVQAVISTVSPDKAQVVKTVVTLQDINRQCFDGGKYSIEDLVDFALMDHLSKDFKINVTDDDINRYCQKMNLSKEQLKHISDSNWFPSLEAFYELFKKNYRGRMAMNVLVDSQLVVMEDEIEKFWKDNPVWLEPVYFVEIATVPLNGKDSDTVQKEITEKEKRNNLSDLEWGAVAKILESDVGEDNKFIFDLAPGDVYLKPDNAEITLYRLKDKNPKRKKPLVQRKKEITNHLKMGKSTKVESQEKENLRRAALISRPKHLPPDSTKDLNMS